MALFVLDTDILRLFGLGNSQVKLRVHSQPAGKVAISVISVQEQLTGWQALLRRSSRHDRLASAYRRLAETVLVLAQFPILSFPEPAIARFESLRAQRLNVGSYDLRIASIALEAGATLVTRNRRDFARVPGLGDRGLEHLSESAGPGPPIAGVPPRSWSRPAGGPRRWRA